MGGGGIVDLSAYINSIKRNVKVFFFFDISNYFVLGRTNLSTETVAGVVHARGLYEIRIGFSLDYTLIL